LPSKFPPTERPPTAREMFRSVGLSVALAQILGHAVAAAADRPNVLFIVADDLGLNDVPFTGTGSEVKTPYLQRLADEGTVLKHYYVNQVCTPTRASFMSAKYPIHLGLQHGVIRDSVPNGLPLSEKIMPQVFQDAGYSTHMVRAAFANKYTSLLFVFPDSC